MADLSEIKRRLERNMSAADAQAPEKSQPVEGESHNIQDKAQEELTLRPETLAQLKSYHKAVEEMEKGKEEKVDLGPLPEGVKVPVETDTTFYRNSNFDNKKVRAAVEARCKEMDFADLVLTGRVNQEVPVIPGKVVFEFQSLTGADSYWIESNAQSETHTDWGLKSWVMWAQLTMSLVSLNGRPFPNHLGKDGDVDPKLFREKQAKIMKMGAKLLDIALTNMNWFNERVDKILENDFEQLGNG